MCAWVKHLTSPLKSSTPETVDYTNAAMHTCMTRTQMRRYLATVRAGGRVRWPRGAMPTGAKQKPPCRATCARHVCEVAATGARQVCNVAATSNADRARAKFATSRNQRASCARRVCDVAATGARHVCDVAATGARQVCDVYSSWNAHTKG